MNASFLESLSADDKALLQEWANTLSVEYASLSNLKSFPAALESLKQHAIGKIKNYLAEVNSAAKTEIKTENVQAAVKEFNVKYARAEIKVDDTFKAQGKKGVEALSAIFQRMNACDEALKQIEAKLPKPSLQEIWNKIGSASPDSAVSRFSLRRS